MQASPVLAQLNGEKQSLLSVVTSRSEAKPGHIFALQACGMQASEPHKQAALTKRLVRCAPAFRKQLLQAINACPTGYCQV